MSMKYGLFRKGLVLGIIVLFVGSGILPSTGTILEKTTSTVIGSPGYIQDLIDNASAGDTINIPSGTYYENIVIDKSIDIIGEDRITTVIDGSRIGDDVVKTTSDWVNISGFTIQNSGFYYWMNSGIHISSNHTTVMDNIISNNYHGIFLYSSNHNIIKDNIISNNNIGIETYIPNILFNTNNNTISDNIITSNNNYGIYLHGSSNTISGNTITDNRFGINLQSADNNIINGNKIISNSEYGIHLLESGNNIIRKNNFRDNEPQLTFFDGDNTNKWMQNYWNRPRLLPKLIFGIIWVSNPPSPFPSPRPRFNIDWHPALKPYNI